MQIQNIRKGSEAFESKFKPLERDSNYSNANSYPSNDILSIRIKNCNHSNWIQGIRIQIRTIRKEFEAFESKFDQLVRNSKHSNANSNLSKEIQSIRMQIRTLRTRFESFECKFKTFEREAKHLNRNSNHSKGIPTIRT